MQRGLYIEGSIVFSFPLLIITSYCLFQTFGIYEFLAEGISVLIERYKDQKIIVNDPFNRLPILYNIKQYCYTVIDITQKSIVL